MTFLVVFHSVYLALLNAVLDEICAALEALGVAVEQVHPESAAGQFEIATGPAGADAAADGAGAQYCDFAVFHCCAASFFRVAGRAAKSTAKNGHSRGSPPGMTI